MPIASLHAKRVLVMGLGQFGGGVGVTRFLASQGAIVTVTDTAGADKLQSSLEKLADLPQGSEPGGITYKLGGHDLADFTASDLLVTNPAVDKATSPYVQAALAANVPLTSEMMLFLERCCAFTIGITGSVGKSTTTMLVYLALRAALAPKPSQDLGVKAQNSVFLGGNIGKSLLLDLPAIRATDIVVLEISSFMLEDTAQIRWSPNVAVVTNLFANHLDRHGTLEGYAAAKQNILRFQKPGDVALFNADHETVRVWASLARGKHGFFSTKAAAPVPLLMPGEHNQSNAQAALGVLDALPPERFPHIDRAGALEAIARFRGLAHRLELVHVSHVNAHEIRWYNDSKATTPEASLTALDAFPHRNAIFIIGGYDKHVDMSAFEKNLAHQAAAVVGIGQTGAVMIERIGQLNPHASARVAYAETLDRAAAQAWTWATEMTSQGVAGPPPAIVLSPASASWDQFQNYERRGEHFARLAAEHP